MTDINKDFQDGFASIEKLLKEIKPDITDVEIRIVKIGCRKIANDILIAVGNSINSKTKEIRL